MSKSLFGAIIAIAAMIARAEKITITAAKNQLADAMKAVKPPKLPTGVTQDEFGGLKLPGESTIVYDLDALAYARTPQQIGNICAQLSVDAEGNPVPGGPAPPGWDQGQVWNRFVVPLQRLVGYRPDGSAIWEQVDGKSDQTQPKWLYARVRIRAKGDATRVALAEFHASGPR
jgi:hypothetical protein